MRRRFALLILMLIVSLLVATSAAYAWVTLSKQASYQSSLIQASASGKLRIYANTADSETYPRIYDNYRREIFFDDETDPFYSLRLIDHLMSDQSGDGINFFSINELSPNSYKRVNGYGDALTIDIWFSAYNYELEEEAEDYNKTVFLTNEASLTIDQEISRATRVAFIKDNALIGIWAPNAITDELTYVTEEDYESGNVGLASGRIKENPEEGEVLLIKGGHPAIATPLFNLDASTFDEEGKDVITLVIWFEGTDDSCVDAYLGQNVEINLVFGVRNAIE